MNLKFIMDDRLVVNVDVDLAALAGWAAPVVRSTTGVRSTPISVNDAKYVLSKVQSSTAVLLQAIADNDGTILWTQAVEILGLSGEDWGEFSNGPNRGITRALRFVTKNPAARLIWWNDDWDDDWSDGTLHIDGNALASLKAAIGR